MRPLQLIAVGLVLMLFDFNIGDPQIDVVPDPVGWGVIFAGVRGLSAAIPFRTALRTLATLAGVISLMLWLPGFADGLRSANTSVLWALDLPAMAFVGTLAVAMMRAAYDGGDFSARGWWRGVLAGLVMTVLLPLLVYGGGTTGGSAGLVVLIVMIALVTLVTSVVLCVAHAKRPWVEGPAATMA